MFSSKTIAFLRKLKKNNDRAWFHAHRDEYERHVRAPMVEVVDRLAQDLRGFAPELVADPKVSLFRPWRDTRFSEDKAPLKTNIAAGFPNRTLGRMNGAGMYCGGGHHVGVDRRRRLRARTAGSCTPSANTSRRTSASSRPSSRRRPSRSWAA